MYQLPCRSSLTFFLSFVSETAFNNGYLTQKWMTVKFVKDQRPQNTIIMEPPRYVDPVEHFSCELLKVISIKLSFMPLSVS